MPTTRARMKDPRREGQGQRKRGQGQEIGGRGRGIATARDEGQGLTRPILRTEWPWRNGKGLSRQKK